MRLLRLGPVLALLVLLLCLAGCQAVEQAAPSQLESAISLAPETTSPSPAPAPEPASPAEKSQESSLQTGMIPEQVLEGETGMIHYSFRCKKRQRKGVVFPAPFRYTGDSS